MPHLVAAPDKFRGTATASEIAAAIEWAAHDAGWTCDRAPVADGGEGLLDALDAHFDGRRRRTRVTGPLGEPVEAEWLLAGTTAVIEMARASGLLLAGGPERNDPLNATTKGTGELIAAAVAAGAKEIIVGVGGSATTDGGQGALEALHRNRLGGVRLVVACDVTTRFLDAPAEFGPQKGASDAQVAFLTRRLERLAADYGPDVTTRDGSGAAGGLAGGLATLGAELVSGFDFVAELIDLPERVEGADLVVAGEGRLDQWSFGGKAVGGVAAIARAAAVPLLIVAGEVAPDAIPTETTPTVTTSTETTPTETTRTEPTATDATPVLSLTERFGSERALRDPTGCVAEALADHLAARRPPA